MQIKRPKKSDKKPSTLRRFHYFTKLRNAHLILNPLRVSRYLGITTVLCKSKSLFGTLFCIDSMQNVQKVLIHRKSYEKSKECISRYCFEVWTIIWLIITLLNPHTFGTKEWPFYHDANLFMGFANLIFITELFGFIKGKSGSGLLVYDVIWCKTRRPINVPIKFRS